MPCLAPLLLIGSLLSVSHNPAPVTPIDSSIMNIQTCEQGPGIDILASPGGPYSVALQYGQPIFRGPFTVTLTPKFGVGLLEHRVPAETSTLNFSLGLQALAGWDHARVAVGYWHMSNAGLGAENAGIELLTVLAGWSFH